MSDSLDCPPEERREFLKTAIGIGVVGIGISAGSPTIAAQNSASANETNLAANTAVSRDTLQAQLAIGRRVRLAIGTISLDDGHLALADGQTIEGDSNQYSVVTSAGAGPAIVREKDAGRGVRVGPILTSFEVKGRQAVRFGDPGAAILDDNLNDAFFPWRLQDMRLTDTGNHAAGSYGFQGSKLFDGQMASSIITGFGTSVLLQGCDNNLIVNNRFWGFTEFAVYEASAQSFGSHNWLCFNDIVSSTGNKSIYDKSFAQHPRRLGNYYELSPCKGALDFSLIDTRVFGRNVPTTSLVTIILRDNRIDSQGNGGFVYRVDPTRATTIRIEGVQTSDHSSTPSMFVDADGKTIDFFPMHLSSGRTSRVYIEETTFGPHWDGHRSKQGVTPNGRGFRITAENAASIAYGSPLTGADGVAHFRGQQIIIPAGNAARAIGIFPDGYLSGNRYFTEGALYRVTLLARSSRTTGDTLSVQQAVLDRAGSPVGTAFATRSLTSQFRALDFYFTGRPVSDKATGFNVRSETSVGDIEFTLSWEEIEGNWTSPVRIGAVYYWTSMSNGKPYSRPATSLPASDRDGTVVEVR